MALFLRHGKACLGIRPKVNVEGDGPKLNKNYRGVYIYEAKFEIRMKPKENINQCIDDPPD